MNRTILYALLTVFLVFMSYADAPFEFEEAYNDLGLIESQGELDTIREKYRGKSIRWILTIKAKYKSGKPLFKETGKRINISTQLGIARFDYTAKEIQMWSQIEIGSKVVITGDVASIEHGGFNLDDGSKGTVVYLVIKSIRPEKLVSNH